MIVKERISVAEQFLSTLSKLSSGSVERILYGRPVIVFEIVATGEGTIVFQAGVEKDFLII